MNLLVALALLAHAPRPLALPWKELAPGVESATVADLGGDANWAAKVVLVEPGRATFAVRYDPARPTIAEWRARYPDALAIVNGSFYSTDGPAGAEVRPTCDVIAAGRSVRGAGCHRQDALFFAAQARAPATQVAPAPQGAAAPQSAPAAAPQTAALQRAVPSKAAAPRVPDAKVAPASSNVAASNVAASNPASSSAGASAPTAPQILAGPEFRAEQWTEALKSFPALVHAGVPACLGVHYCAESSRTAAVAQLRDGRIVLFASQWPAIRKNVGAWLAQDLGAVEALNLDGGPEATLALHGEPLEDIIGTQGVGLPMVIVLLPPASR